MAEDLTALIEQKRSDGELLQAALDDPGLVGELVQGLSAAPARYKYGCLRSLRSISRQEPALVEEEIATFAKLTKSDNSFLRWGAMLILANLAPVDRDQVVDGLMATFYASMKGPKLVDATNAIKSVAQIAQSKPYLAPTAAEHVMNVEEARFDKPECLDIAIGHAISALEAMLPMMADKTMAIAFAERHLESDRAATRRRAERFLKRAGKRPRTSRDGTMVTESFGRR